MACQDVHQSSNLPSQTPLSALSPLEELALEPGVSRGCAQYCHGFWKAIGKAILENPKVRKVSFYRFNRSRAAIGGAFSQNLTRLSLELGGHAPFIVFDDADLDAAIQGALVAKLRNMGQTCIAANRFLVQSGIYEAFAERLKQALEPCLLAMVLKKALRSDL